MYTFDYFDQVTICCDHQNVTVVFGQGFPKVPQVFTRVNLHGFLGNFFLFLKVSTGNPPWGLLWALQLLLVWMFAFFPHKIPMDSLLFIVQKPHKGHQVFINDSAASAVIAVMDFTNFTDFNNLRLVREKKEKLCPFWSGGFSFSL